MSKTKKIAVILSGCGVYDGSEIHEATLCLYFISHHGAEYQVFAPDINQHHVINHLTGKEMNETRNVLIESARIARGKISPLSEFRATEFDGLIFPGGYGVAKNLSDWAFKGQASRILPEVERCVRDMAKAGKPVAALCIAPVLYAKIFGNVDLTVGDDESTIREIESLGTRHQTTSHGEIIVDTRNKLITSPCYMLDASIDQVGKGVENAVKALLEFA